MELGPNQTRWLEALEAGTYKQGKRRLRNINDEYCCLGVAAELFKQQEPIADETCYAYCGQTGLAPRYVVEALSLRSKYGNLIGHLHYKDGPYFSLTDANDAGMSFKELAQHVRAAPERFFTESR